MKRIAFDPLRCSLCGACMAACTLSKAGKPDLSRSRIRIETAGSCVPLRAAVCRHCEEPACVTACMRGIIDRDPETGLVTRRQLMLNATRVIRMAKRLAQESKGEKK